MKTPTSVLISLPFTIPSPPVVLQCMLNPNDWRMIDMGIYGPSNSPWASPLHFVSKMDGTQRPCGDYRALNAITVPDRYPIPHLQDFNCQLSGNKFFSKFHHVPIAPEDVQKTAVTTPFGLFEFIRLSFGLRNAAQSFQCYLHSILGDLDFAYSYIDDILIVLRMKLNMRFTFDKFFGDFQKLV